MKKKIHPLTTVLIIGIALVVIALVYQQRLEVAVPTIQPQVVANPQGPPEEVPSLGIAWSPIPMQKGARVDKLLSGPPPSRLAMVGVKVQDVLWGVNDKKDGSFIAIGNALDELITKGKPFTLNITRGGQEVRLAVKNLPKGTPTTEEILKMRKKSLENVSPGEQPPSGLRLR